jgi:hypothetical protein
MSTPNEQATEGSSASDPAEAGEPAGAADQEPADGPPDVAPDPAAPAQETAASNRWATGSLVSGILGVTGVGVVLGIVFGVLGLNRAKRGQGGRVRSWLGIAAALVWAGAFIYVAPHVAKAADPGCTSFKESALTHYNRAIEDLGSTTNSVKTTTDLGNAIIYLRAAAAKSKDAASRKALDNLAAQLTTARNDEISGRIPASAIRALNHDAAAADSACGTF